MEMSAETELVASSAGTARREAGGSSGVLRVAATLAGAEVSLGRWRIISWIRGENRVVSILLYASESLTLTAELEKITQTFEMKCYLRLQNISFNELVTDGDVRRKIQATIGKMCGNLRKCRKVGLVWFCESYGRDGFCQHNLGI